MPPKKKVKVKGVRSEGGKKAVKGRGGHSPVAAMESARVGNDGAASAGAAAVDEIRLLEGVDEVAPGECIETYEVSNKHVRVKFEWKQPDGEKVWKEGYATLLGLHTLKKREKQDFSFGFQRVPVDMMKRKGSLLLEKKSKDLRFFGQDFVNQVKKLKKEQKESNHIVIKPIGKLDREFTAALQQVEESRAGSARKQKGRTKQTAIYGYWDYDHQFHNISGTDDCEVLAWEMQKRKEGWSDHKIAREKKKKWRKRLLVHESDDLPEEKRKRRIDKFAVFDERIHKIQFDNVDSATSSSDEDEENALKPKAAAGDKKVSMVDLVEVPEDIPVVAGELGVHVSVLSLCC